MYSAAPPPMEPAAKLDESWGLRRGVRLDFPGSAALAKNAAHTELLREYLADMLRPHGLMLDAEKLEAGGQSYGEMAEALIGMAVRKNEPVDLLVVASAVPDITPGRSTAIYLSHVCPGTPLAFAISDQGPAATFTGLRLIGDYARTDGFRRALLLIVEQSALPYDTGSAGLPTANSGVALLIGSDGSDGGGDTNASGRLLRPDVTRVLTGIRAPEVAFSGALGLIAPDATVILGNALAPYAGALTSLRRVRIARSGQPTTGVWWELVGALAEHDESERASGCVVVADYDIDSAALCLAVFSANR